MSSLPIIIEESPNFDDRPFGTVIDTIIIHYTGMPTMGDALDRLSDTSPEAHERGRVSAHYALDEIGQIYALVDERDRAWHAGVSYWRGKSNLNDNSIGIELMNVGHDLGYPPFPRMQMDSLIELCTSISKRHPIARDLVLGHSDIAPGRKMDPGEKFNWRLMAKNNLGFWPEPEAEDYQRGQMFSSSPTALRAALIKFGYNPEVSTEVMCQAFNQHYGRNMSTNLTFEVAACLSWLNRNVLKKAA